MDILNCVSQAIFDKKGINILALDVRNCATTADYVVIAEGLADRHVISIGEAILNALNKRFPSRDISLCFQQGMQSGDWVVLDFSWLVVHLFMPGIRDHYDLECLWRSAEVVDVDIQVSHLACAF